jgi:hypothetical protein
MNGIDLTTHRVDQRRYRLLAAARVVVGTLSQINPTYPPPENLRAVVVE